MKIVVTREGVEKYKDFECFTYNDKAAIEFLANLFQDNKEELPKADQSN